jgi:hypothetical protein
MPLLETKGAGSAQGFGLSLGGEEAVYIEDVFSTYLYTGNGSTQTITNGISLGDKFVGTSTYFNGTAYLSRSSDLSGNSDGKTFTFSAWVYADTLTGGFYIYRSGTGSQFWVIVNDDGKVTIRGFDNIDNSSRLNVDLPANTVVARQWTNILISFDLTSTSTRYVYVNDVAVTPTYSAYQNYNIDFTNSSHFIAAGSASSGKLTGYVTNIFLDYTYRDLSVTANRRYFIDANRCSTPSSTLSALNPILYLPLTTSTTLNAGSGGNFTANSSPVIADKGTDFSAGYGKGGLVWMKGRSGSTDHALYDTARGATKDLVSNSTAAETTQATGLTAFNTTGFSIGALAKINTNAATYVSWTFRKQPKFFDVVTYTGTGSNRTIAHSLNSVPGCIIVKRTDTTGDWQVYHRANTANPETDYLVLNSTAATADSDTRWNDTLPTSTVFSLGTQATVNASGGTYVAYLFAHDAGGFGLTGTDNVISCGSYTGNNNNNGPEITLGYEPQWVMIKNVTTAGNAWRMLDNMRGMDVNTTGSGDGLLSANAASAEAYTNRLSPTATGFKITDTAGDVNSPSGNTFIYIAIRRGPMEVPTSGTSVFTPIARTGTGSAANITSAGFPPDLLIGRSRLATTSTPVFVDRLRGNTKFLQSAFTDAEGTSTAGGDVTGFLMNGFSLGFASGTDLNSSGASEIYYPMRRAPGFFDVVCYTGTGSAVTQAHNLGTAPELIIFKPRSYTDSWYVLTQFTSTNESILYLNLTNARNNNTYAAHNVLQGQPTSSAFALTSSPTLNTSAATYVAYLFATCAGVSKVGSYTGTGTTLQINCGFTGGARFVLIKRTDSTGDWYVWDTARGIIAGNDPYLLLNSTAAEVTSTDYVDTYSAGFEISSTAPAAINANGGTYIFLAIA